MGPRKLLLVEADLMGQTRLEPAAKRAGWEVESIRAGALVDALAARDCGLVIADLDRGRDAVIGALSEASQAGLLPERVVGYYSHVDDELGRRARTVGCRALPRGRFWSTLETLLTGD